MKLPDVGEPIAIRTLHWRDDGGIMRKVIVMIGKPLPFHDSSGHYCPYQIRGVGSEEVECELGVDGVEAIQAAMKAIGLAIYVFNEENGRRLRWGPYDSTDLGFPLPKSTLRYESGEEIQGGDKVLFHGGPGEIEFVVDKLTGDPGMDWYFKTMGPGVMILEGVAGRTYDTSPEDEEDLVFVSRRNTG